MIDAGSSGTRVHVFSYHLPTVAHTYGSVRLPDAQLRLTPGLSSFSPMRAADAAASLEPLLQFAREQVPQPLWATTPVHLMATAGVRMLPHAHAAAVLAACRARLAGSGFHFEPDWVRVLPGALEGVYAWVAINYAAGTLQAMAKAGARPGAVSRPLGPADARPDTWGVFELGGASMQMTLLALEQLPPGSDTLLSLPGLSEAPLFAHSFLGFGLDTAFVRAARLARAAGGADPCLLSGYTAPTGALGGGNFTACAQICLQLLAHEGRNHGTAGHAGKCKFKRCSIGGVFLPQLTGRHLAVENFHYSARRLGLPPNASLAELAYAGTAFCARPWADVKRELVDGTRAPQAHVAKACFAAAYIHTLLRHGFHIGPHERKLLFSNSVRGLHGNVYDVNWVTGALLATVVHAQHGGPDNRAAQDAAVGPPRVAAMPAWLLMRPWAMVLLLVLGTTMVTLLLHVPAVSALLGDSSADSATPRDHPTDGDIVDSAAIAAG